MKKVITICDRCGDATGLEEAYYWLETTHKIINLCEKCWYDFKVFMEEKGRVHLWKRKEIKAEWIGKWDGFEGDPNNPFPLKKEK